MQVARPHSIPTPYQSKASHRDTPPPPMPFSVVIPGNRPFAVCAPRADATEGMAPSHFAPAPGAELLDMDSGQLSTDTVTSGQRDDLPSCGLDTTPGDSAALNRRTRELDAAWRLIKNTMAQYERSSAWREREINWPIECRAYLPPSALLTERLSAPLEQFTEDFLFARCLRAPATMDILRPCLIAWCEASACTQIDREIAALYLEAAAMVGQATFDDLLAHPRLRGVLTALQTNASNNGNIH